VYNLALTHGLRGWVETLRQVSRSRLRSPPMQWMPSHTGLSHAPPLARIESISAEVDLSGVRRRVSFVLTPQVRVGEYVLIHSGLAISILDEDEAEETL
jgi:hydrogenase expression/formation protein HypC